MSKINPNASLLIDEYLNSKAAFSNEICELLRELIHIADNSITEDWKWNIPIFHKNGLGMVCGFAGFKKHVSLTFFNGVLMSDKYQLFTNDCNAQKTRTIKFSNISEIKNNQLLEYFIEAVSLGEIPSNKTPLKKEFIIPELLQKALNKNQLAKINFENMAYTYKKEYALHISEAKRDTTKLKRLEKIISNLEQNIKMHEQYKC